MYRIYSVISYAGSHNTPMESVKEGRPHVWEGEECSWHSGIRMAKKLILSKSSSTLNTIFLKVSLGFCVNKQADSKIYNKM